MYRPTVRYDDLYKSYVDQVFRATTLDRNQIIRLALFAAPFSPLFQNQIKKHMTSSPPPAEWEVTNHGLWMDRTYVKEEERRDVNGHTEKISTIGEQLGPGEQPGQIEGSPREVFTQRVFKQQGGVTIKFG